MSIDHGKHERLRLRRDEVKAALDAVTEKVHDERDAAGRLNGALHSRSEFAGLSASDLQALVTRKTAEYKRDDITMADARALERGRPAQAAALGQAIADLETARGIVAHRERAAQLQARADELQAVWAPLAQLVQRLETYIGESHGLGGGQHAVIVA